jgi:hypothetical protein
LPPPPIVVVATTREDEDVAASSSIPSIPSIPSSYLELSSSRRERGGGAAGPKSNDAPCLGMPLPQDSPSSGVIVIGDDDAGSTMVAAFAA